MESRRDENSDVWCAGDYLGENKIMKDYALDEILPQNTKIIYVKDFINMWLFFVELAAVEDDEVGVIYPIYFFLTEKCLPVETNNLK
jgi:hypothetical protein